MTTTNRQVLEQWRGEAGELFKDDKKIADIGRFLLTEYIDSKSILTERKNIFWELWFMDFPRDQIPNQIFQDCGKDGITYNLNGMAIQSFFNEYLEGLAMNYGAELKRVEVSNIRPYDTIKEQDIEGVQVRIL
jgi:hypothetical protein